MSRQQALQMAAAYFDEGHFRNELAPRIAQHTESQEAASGPALRAYLTQQIAPALEALGFTWHIVDNPLAGKPPFLTAERLEPGAGFTVLSYAHGDVVRGYDNQWRAGLDPWQITVDGDRWYGRGTADNKGQHTVNLAALARVLKVRGGKLGYNFKIIFEMGEEIGSPGLEELCEQHKDALSADVLIASDGPRLAASKPTLFLGSRGVFNFELRAKLREGAHHSGNWGGVLRNPGIRLANALASLVDEKGRILLKGLLPAELPSGVRDALKTIEVGGSPGDPEVDPQWGEPDLTPAERLLGWNAFDVLAFKTGNPDAPANAIPGVARATCSVRYVVGSDTANFPRHIREHLDRHGYTDIEILHKVEPRMIATRVDPDDPWVRWGLASMARTTGKAPSLLPNLGGTIPNHCFAYTLNLPTLWVPHSYPGCLQHAPNEHLLSGVAREALQIMAGMFWDLGEEGAKIMAERRT
ncbi:MAG: hypothetical protein JWO70_4215 [Betaproteobacteria bacterium]|nr:hypothetical protein [Betaproteobacteria bacterium]